MSQVLAISAPRPCFRPKLGHDIPLIHSTDWSEQHLTQTSREPELKHKLNFDFHTGHPPGPETRKFTFSEGASFCIPYGEDHRLRAVEGASDAGRLRVVSGDARVSGAGDAETADVFGSRGHVGLWRDCLRVVMWVLAF